jgi:hypothetical protein
MCFALIRGAFLAHRIHRRQQAKANAQQQQQQQQYANPAAPYTTDGTTGVIYADKPQTTVTQVS